MSQTKDVDKILSQWEDSIKLNKKMGLEGVVRYEVDTAEALLALARAGVRAHESSKLPSRVMAALWAFNAGMIIEYLLK